MSIRWNSVASAILLTGLVACSSLQSLPAQAKTAPLAAEQSAQLASVPIDHATSVGGKLIFGQVEWVTFPNIDQRYRARVDTGAHTSSLNATDIKIFQRHGKPWVRFKIASKSGVSDPITVPVVHWIRIISANSDHPQRRPVVICWIKIGDHRAPTAFTLADREHLKYPILLGRSYFKNKAIIDVSRRYVQGK